VHPLFWFCIFFGVVGLYVLVSRIVAQAIAKRWALNAKVIEYSIAVIVFLVCSYLWVYTGVYQAISEFTGIPLERGTGF
jgi:putative copper export protein